MRSQAMGSLDGEADDDEAQVKLDDGDTNEEDTKNNMGDARETDDSLWAGELEAMLDAAPTFQSQVTLQGSDWCNHQVVCGIGVWAP